ncbi:MAG: dTDP-glucose 4,6-dehydratase [Gemmatimonadales bacterium]|nr:MAG: dTDP-glucose 4,6-dehydratase [Gemmatimonadales bacterium]
MRLLVTGGAGSIGSTLIRFLLRERPQAEILNLDLLTYAGDLSNLEGVEGDPRHTFVHGDICDGALVRELMEGVDAVLNLAAESHVDRSIQRPAPFVQTNVVGTRVLLDAAGAAGVPRFVQVSTDEVYGDLPWANPEADHPHRSTFSESTPLQPRSPYSASKAAADLLVLSYHNTYGMDVVIPRGSNNYGPHQHREKLIPLMATRAMGGEPLPVFGDGLHVRDWMFVEDFCSGIVATLERGRSGEIYNFGGGTERTNLQVVRAILRALGLAESLITFVPDRPGHDRRYAMDCSKARRELDWEARADFEGELVRTVEWYRKHAGTRT